MAAIVIKPKGTTDLVMLSRKLEVQDTGCWIDKKGNQVRIDIIGIPEAHVAVTLTNVLDIVGGVVAMMEPEELQGKSPLVHVMDNCFVYTPDQLEQILITYRNVAFREALGIEESYTGCISESMELFDPSIAAVYDFVAALDLKDADAMVQYVHSPEFEAKMCAVNSDTSYEDLKPYIDGIREHVIKEFV